MKIRLNVYSPGVHEIHETITVDELGLDPQTFRAVDARLTLHRHDPFLDFRFRLLATVELECDRCLEAYQDNLAVDVPMIYVLGRSLHSDDVDDPNYVEVPAGTIDLDITDDVRDQLIISLPEKRLCTDGCLGLCPLCGANRNSEVCRCAA